MRISDWSSDVCSSDLSWKRRPRLHHVWGRTHLCIVLFGRNDEPSVEGGPQIVREVKEEGRELLQFRNGPDFILAGTDSGSLVRFGREENDVPSAVDQCLFQNKCCALGSIEVSVNTRWYAQIDTVAAYHVHDGFF